MRNAPWKSRRECLFFLFLSLTLGGCVSIQGSRKTQITEASSGKIDLNSRSATNNQDHSRSLPDKASAEQEVFFRTLKKQSTPKSLLAAELKDSLPRTAEYFIWPLQGGRYSSNFGIRRHRFHKGVDLVAPRGTPVFASSYGTVLFVGRRKGYGNMIIIEHNDKLTYYAHLSAMIIKAGDLVEQGQEIGKVGATGRASGPHLHFEIRSAKENKPLDPWPFLPPPPVPTLS